MSIKAKLFIMMVTGCVAVVLVSALGLFGIKHSNNDIQDIYAENMTNVMEISRIMELMRDNRIHLLLALQHDPKDPAIVRLHDHPTSFHTDIVKKNIEEITTLWNKYTSRPMGAEEKRLVDDFAAKRTVFVKEGLLSVLEAELAGDFAKAAHLIVTKCNPTFKPADEAAKAIYAHESEEAKRTYQDASSAYRRTLVIIALAVLAAIAVSAIIGFMVQRSITSATDTLARVSQAVAGGDLSQRIQLTTKDELGSLGTSVNAMTDAFAQIIRRVADSSAQVATAAQQLTVNAERTATGAEQVACQAETVATASEEMSATSMDISRNCQLAADNSYQASTAVNEGAEVVRSTVGYMNNIAQRVKGTAASVEALGQRSDQIGAIVATIQDIADQTNLLALNAAIEAARAGEMGRGFAVVADEVRALAERTTRATREIGEMIKAIQNETRSAVQAMEEGVQEVERGTEGAARSGRALEDILAQINEVNLQVAQIATAAEEQTATTSQITGNIHQMTAVVGQSSAAANESATAAARLSQLAEELQSLVSRFRA
ncbi:HAMP domain-containing methyl-accepting chemotaxis protein [Trichlorobacter ammonificans]|uniref:Methyl-accepting chemotaxis sensory transducer with TarH sensor n=1 Tax=Trichlorobacter ammonificans TaxID=2916410 RepID=A0ABN8HFF3_9BACT|nr:methyl-accepting chemotaxis protein [Trichlorobacter ammonificans]CAH2030637.1 Methyl-accepting chemotaxis sensory transducer with TarH sensor [Trichlorobacter ammonificans]